LWDFGVEIMAGGFVRREIGKRRGPRLSCRGAERGQNFEVTPLI